MTIDSITRSYVERFYPLWLNHHQTKLDPSNRLVGPERISPLYQAVVAINDDTLYASSPIDLKSEPVILAIPGNTALSYSILNLNPYGDVFDPGIQSKKAGCEMPTKIYGLVPNGYQGRLPREVVRIEMPLDFSILIFRIDRFVETTDMTEPARKFRREILLQTLTNYKNDPSGGATRILPEAAFGGPFKTLADELIKSDPIRYLNGLQEAVKSPNTPPLSHREAAIADAFDAAFGDGGSAVTPSTRIAFAKGARTAKSAIIENYLEKQDPNHWIHFTNMGDWKADEFLDRASIAEFIQYGNTIKTSAYYHTFLDDRGKALKGSTKGGYVLTFPKGGGLRPSDSGL